MLEVVGNLWYYQTVEGKRPDCLVITTNGTIKRDGTCVMGRGCAREAKDRWPHLALALGQHLRENGNVPHIFRDCGPVPLVSFPVKHDWHDIADPALIRTSGLALSALADAEGWDVVVMPRPGCGNGSLDWKDVRPLLSPILDDRFHMITFNKGVK